MSDLGATIADMMSQHRPDRVVIERSGDWQSVQEAVMRTAVIKSYVLPQIFWKPTASTPGIQAKTLRIKNSLEPLVHESKVFFSSAIPILEQAFDQMVRFDGIHKSNSTRKDDFPDCLAVLTSTFYPRDSVIVLEKTEEQQEFEEQARLAAYSRGQYDRLFGSGQPPPQQYMPPGPNDDDPNFNGGIHSALSRFGLLRRSS